MRGLPRGIVSISQAERVLAAADRGTTLKDT